MITVLLLTLNGCFCLTDSTSAYWCLSGQRRLLFTFVWRRLTFTQTVLYVYPVARLKRHIFNCDVNMHKHEPNVSTPRHILQVTKIRVKPIIYTLLIENVSGYSTIIFPHTHQKQGTDTASTAVCSEHHITYVTAWLLRFYFLVNPMQLKCVVATSTRWHCTGYF